ncbi:MAG: flippase-like domain-containing protein, partial [Rhodospirillaceae bacterium]|nr:flippase-like domain-containing protein [Rhodospirillaceae bacterium]
IEPAWIAAAAAAFAVQIVAAGLRWRGIAANLGTPVSAARAVRYSAIAAFFNQALPSTVGGDAMRVWLLGRTDRRWKPAIYSVILDRVAGVVFLAAVVAACLPWSLERIAAPAGQATVLVIGLGGLATIPFILIFGSVRIGGRLGKLRLVRFAFEIAAAARTGLFTAKRIVPLAVVSIFIHLLTIGAAWCLARGVALAPDGLNFLILIPPVVLVSMVPVSIGGWGIREGAMVVAFSYAGIERSEALAVSVLMGLTTLAVGVAGGAFWIAERGPGLRAGTSAVAAGTEPNG